ncbi:hypothetical protein QOT17_000510 [Balamuthia mandrillaris]
MASSYLSVAVVGAKDPIFGSFGDLDVFRPDEGRNISDIRDSAEHNIHNNRGRRGMEAPEQARPLQREGSYPQELNPFWHAGREEEEEEGEEQSEEKGVNREYLEYSGPVNITASPGTEEPGDQEYDDSPYNNHKFIQSSERDMVTTDEPPLAPLTSSQDKQEQQEKKERKAEAEAANPKEKEAKNFQRKASLVFDWFPKQKVHESQMVRLIKVNCLVKGDRLHCTPGLKWLVAVDNTPASVRAVNHAIEKANPDDHIIILNARVMGPYDTLEDTYQTWRRAVFVCRKFKKMLVDAKKEHTVLIPVYKDPRKITVHMAKKLKVQYIVLGKHGAEDKKSRVKNLHFRSFTTYVRHARSFPGEVFVV